jgi:diacylglycerol kinase (ATP)
VPFEARPSRRILVIFNPTAGPRRRRRLMQVLKALDELGATVALRETAARGDAETIARQADPRAFDLIVAAGGDGTINEVVNGLAESPLPLALIPLGTANVLAHEIGLGRDARRLAEAIARGAPRPIHLGSANGRRFAMMLGVGIDARIVKGLDLRLKKWAGKLAYVMSALSALATYRPAHYGVEIDGEPHDAAALIVAKGHYYGGRFVLAKAARLDQPVLQVVLMRRSGRWNVLRYAAAIALNRLDRLSDVRVIPARTVTVRGPVGESAQTDGDLGVRLPVTVSVCDHPLPLIGA